jgi:hypothetical protein
MTAGFQPLIYCTPSLAGSGKMMGQELGLAFDEIREFLLQHSGDATMQLLPLSAQQHAISAVLQERVLEDVFVAQVEEWQPRDPQADDRLR